MKRKRLLLKSVIELEYFSYSKEELYENSPDWFHEGTLEHFLFTIRITFVPGLRFLRLVMTVYTGSHFV